VGYNNYSVADIIRVIFIRFSTIRFVCLPSFFIHSFVVTHPNLRNHAKF